MDELDRKQTAEHLDLYRIDGRSYDLSEESGVLTLQLRRSVRVERSIVAVLISTLLSMTFGWMIWVDFTSTPDYFGRSFLVVLGMQPLQFCINFVMAMRRGEVWRLDKSLCKVRCNNSQNADFSKIRGVRAWRRGSRFYIALKLRYGQTLKLGRFAFSRSERAWRDDAAQIAAFLGVPLEIVDKDSHTTQVPPP